MSSDPNETEGTPEEREQDFDESSTETADQEHSGEEKNEGKTDDESPSSIDPELIPNVESTTDSIQFGDVKPEDIDLPSEPSRCFIAQEYHIHEDCTARTKKSHLSKYSEFLEYTTGTDPIEVSEKSILNYYTYLGKKEKRVEGTLQNHLSTLFKFHEFMEISNEFDDPQVSSSRLSAIVDCSKLAEAERRFQREAISHEEKEKLYESASSLRNELIIQVLYEMGLRNKDLRELQIDNIDFDDQLVTVENRKNDKTDDIPVREELLIRLDDFIKRWRGTYPEAETHNYLFPSQHGGGLSVSQVTKIVKEAAEEADIQDTIAKIKAPPTNDCDYHEIKRVTPHTLRHSIVTHLIEKELPKDLISYLTGHTSGAIEDYIHKDYTSAFELLRNSID